MRSSDTRHAIAVGAPIGTVLVVVGAALLAADAAAGIVPFLLGVVALAVGVVGAHGLLAHRYGDAGFTGFVVTLLGLIGIFFPAYGVGFVVLVPAAVLLVYALLRMRPPLRGPAFAFGAVWPLSVALAATPLSLGESLALVFAVPYGWLGVEARRLPVPAPE